MKTRNLLFFSICLTVLFPAMGFALQGMYPAVGLNLIMGILWLGLTLKEIPWSTPAFFLLMCMENALLPLFGISPFLALLSVVSGLASWDLHAFINRITVLKEPVVLHRFEQHHLSRLGLTLAGGTVLGVLGLSIHFRLGFFLAFILGMALLVIFWALITRIAPAPQRTPGASPFPEESREEE